MRRRALYPRLGCGAAAGHARLRGRRADRAHHARTGPSAATASRSTMPRELAECVERANLDPAVHVIALAGNGKGFCGGYDLVVGRGSGSGAEAPRLALDPRSGRNHDPRGTWDPVVDWQMMSRNLRGFMSLFHSDKPVGLQGARLLRRRRHRHGAVLDLLVIAEDAPHRLPAGARLGRARPRRCGRTASATERAKRLLFTGDLIDGARGARVGPGDRGAAGGRARRALRGAARADRADAGQPAGDDEAAGQPGALRAGPAGHADARRRSSTASPATRPRATRSPSAPPRPASRRRCASATSRTKMTAGLAPRTADVCRSRGSRPGPPLMSGRSLGSRPDPR